MLNLKRTSSINILIKPESLFAFQTRTQWIPAKVFMRNLALETPMGRNCSVKMQHKAPKSGKRVSQDPECF